MRAPGDEVAVSEALEALLEQDGPLVAADGAVWRYSAERGVWDELSDEVLSRVAQRFSGEYYMAGWRTALNGAKEPRYSRLKLSRSNVKGVVSLLRDRLADPEAFTRAASGLALADGSFVVEDGQLVWREHDPRHRLRFAHPFGHAEVACAAAPLWHAQTLGLVGGDEAAASLLYEWAGLALLGEGTRSQRALVLVGAGGEGKGVWMKALEDTFPPGSVASVAISQCGQEYHRAHLVGALLCSMGDLPRVQVGATAAAYWKGMVTGDKTGARHPGGRVFTFVPRAAWLWSCNELPEPDDLSDGFWRRFLVVQCQRVAPADEAQRIERFEERLAEERPGILRTLLDGARRALERGTLLVPESLQAATAEWRDTASTGHPLQGRLVRWLDEQLEHLNPVTCERILAEVWRAPRERHRSLAREAATLMKALGWTHTRRRLEGKLTWVYEPPAGLAPQSDLPF